MVNVFPLGEYIPAAVEPEKFKTGSANGCPEGKVTVLNFEAAATIPAVVVITFIEVIEPMTIKLPFTVMEEADIEARKVALDT